MGRTIVGYILAGMILVSCSSSEKASKPEEIINYQEVENIGPRLKVPECSKDCYEARLGLNLNVSGRVATGQTIYEPGEERILRIRLDIFSTNPNVKQLEISRENSSFELIYEDKSIPGTIETEYGRLGSVNGELHIYILFQLPENRNDFLERKILLEADLNEMKVQDRLQQTHAFVFNIPELEH